MLKKQTVKVAQNKKKKKNGERRGLVDAQNSVKKICFIKTRTLNVLPWLGKRSITEIKPSIMADEYSQ